MLLLLHVSSPVRLFASMDSFGRREGQVWFVDCGLVYYHQRAAEKLYVRTLGKLLKKQYIVKCAAGFVCPFCDTCIAGCNIRDVIQHSNNTKGSWNSSWDKCAEHQALEDYLRHDPSFAAARLGAGFDR